MKQAKPITEILEQLVSIPSPSGYTDECIHFCENFLKSSGVTTKITQKGALIATIEGEDTNQHRLLTAHVDTLGAMVKEIKSDGTLKLSMIGGFRWNSVEGEYCNIHTASGETYSGTILMHQTSVHVYKNGGEAKRNDDNIEVRIDAEVHNPEDVRGLGIEVGDFISFDPRFQTTDSGFVKSRFLDDKASVAILLQLIVQLKQENIRLPYTTHFYISNNEEIGYGGNASIPEETVEYLAVDMGAIGDGQTTTEYVVSICAKDSSGPYHYLLRQHLVKLAQKESVDYEIDIYPYYGSDASAAIRSGADVKHALIGPGIDASHAFERTHQRSIEHTYNLLHAYVQSKLV
ncbi:M42 family metallopeptidase [Pontibacillus sp. HMF3514]|uniref:M42 family metallopeptidase n=1 Tax=Pontibacillus sp. HMF3514 TaxID=2692425 RepID=UPI00131F6BF7|nr:M42 family metallopeptidase [Pontibacillus sp. HMF3514]QHE52962.1 M20/M25/M40 family metallo-hydrolase [Pontibacillus sp. HMF3514]